MVKRDDYEYSKDGVIKYNEYLIIKDDDCKS